MVTHSTTDHASGCLTLFFSWAFTKVALAPLLNQPLQGCIAHVGTNTKFTFIFYVKTTLKLAKLYYKYVLYTILKTAFKSVKFQLDCWGIVVHER